MSRNASKPTEDTNLERLSQSSDQLGDSKSFVVSRSTVRRNGVRRSHSGGEVFLSAMRPRRNPERNHSSSSTQSATPSCSRQRLSKITMSPENPDPSLTDNDSINSEMSCEIVPLKSPPTPADELLTPRRARRKDRENGKHGGRRRNGSRELLSPREKKSSSGLSESGTSMSLASLGSSSTSFTTPRGKKLSVSTEEEDLADDSSCRGGKPRRERSNSVGALRNRRSSSRKRRSEREKVKRRGNRNPVSVEGTKLVSEDEIMALIHSSGHDPSAVGCDERQSSQKTEAETLSPSVSPNSSPKNESSRLRNHRSERKKSRSISPESDKKKSPRERKANLRDYGVRRSNSASGLGAKVNGIRRSSIGCEELDVKHRKTRVPPRRTRSDDVRAESHGLDNFLKQDQKASGRPKASSGSRSVSGGRSVGSRGISGSRSVATTRSARPRRRRNDVVATNALKPSGSDQLREVEEEEHSVHLSDREDDTDEGSVALDLDLATARDNFAKQSLNEKLQLHLSKTDELLYSVFPKHVADALRNGQKVNPENHDLVTIFFSDIVGFTDISSKLDPLKISDMLDRLYNSFDALSDYHDVFKVETIGDAYMAVTNLTKDQPDHCKRITEFAIDAIRVANQTLVDEENPSMGFVNIRVGFHSGSVVSNVVGTRNPRYCLFGDTVNTASRMESNSQKNRIHCSDASAALLRKQCPRMRIYPRGTIEVKGKGEMETFWVHTEGAITPKDKKNGAIRNIMKAVRNF